MESEACAWCVCQRDLDSVASGRVSGMTAGASCGLLKLQRRVRTSCKVACLLCTMLCDVHNLKRWLLDDTRDEECRRICREEGECMANAEGEWERLPPSPATQTRPCSRHHPPSRFPSRCSCTRNCDEEAALSAQIWVGILELGRDLVGGLVAISERAGKVRSGTNGIRVVQMKQKSEGERQQNE